MSTTQQFSITLPPDIAEAAEEKVKSGRYASVSEVMRDGFLALAERDAGLERWLREEVVAGHREYMADPSKGVPATEILGRIKARRATWRLCRSFSRRWSSGKLTGFIDTSANVPTRSGRIATFAGSWTSALGSRPFLAGAWRAMIC